MEWVVNATFRPLYPRERPGTHCVRGWVGPRTGLDGCGKSRPPPGFDPQTTQPVAGRNTDCAIPAHRRRVITQKKEYITTRWKFELKKYIFGKKYIYETTWLHLSKIAFKRLALPSSGPVPYYIIQFPSGNISYMKYECKCFELGKNAAEDWASIRRWCVYVLCITCVDLSNCDHRL